MSNELSKEAVYGKVGTLGDETGQTCSMDAVCRWGHAGEVIPFGTFELAAKATRSAHIDAFIVPAAYPGVNGFIMDPELEVSETFVSKIPALVLVALREVESTVSRLFHHPATTPLIAELDCTAKERIEVVSNVEACAAAVRDKDSIAITNSLCADYFRIPIRKILREGIKMPWICLTRRPLVGLPRSGVRLSA
jgi:hypothetical protein